MWNDLIGSFIRDSITTLRPQETTSKFLEKHEIIIDLADGIDSNYVKDECDASPNLLLAST